MIFFILLTLLESLYINKQGFRYIVSSDPSELNVKLPPEVKLE
jgi:hypothetical protein